MRIEQIRHFIKAVDALSITKAAEELYITQSVLSKQIAGMEQELSATLFERSKTGIRLTPVGVVAYERFTKVLQAYDNAVHHIREYQSHVEGALTLVKLSGLKQPAALVCAVARFTERFPNVALLRKSMDNGPLTSSLRDGRHDVYLTWEHDVSDKADIDFVPLAKFKVSLAIAASHQLAGAQGDGIDAFRDVHWITILEEESYRLGRLVSKVVRNAGFEPQMIHADNLAGMIDLIHDGAGVGLVCEGHILHGSSSMLFMDFPEIPGWVMGICVRKDNKNPVVAELLSMLRACVAEEG